MIPVSISSDTIHKGWRQARQEGVFVVPVIALPDLGFNNLAQRMCSTPFVNPYLETGNAIVNFKGDDIICTCVVSPDGQTIVTSDKSDQVNFLRLEGEQPQ